MLDFGGSGFSGGTTTEGDVRSFCVVAVDGVGIVRGGIDPYRADQRQVRWISDDALADGARSGGLKL